MGHFYLAAVQSILLYGLESWTLTTQQLHLLDSFHHHCARHITQMHIHPLPDGSWFRPASTDVLQAAGLKPITYYIQQHQQHVTEFAKNLPIFTQCSTSKPTRNTRAHTYWWLLPNDVLNPPDPPTTTTIPTLTHRLNATNHRQNYYQPMPYYNRYASRPTTVLLENPTHPMYHTNYEYHTLDLPTTTTPHTLPTNPNNPTTDMTTRNSTTIPTTFGISVVL